MDVAAETEAAADVVLAVVLVFAFDDVWSHGGVGRAAALAVAVPLLEPEPVKPALAS